MSGDIEKLLETIRRAVLEPEGWYDVQREADRFMGAHGSQLVHVDLSSGGIWTRSTPTTELDTMFAKIGGDSEPVRYATANPNWRSFADYDYITEAEMARSDFYASGRAYDVGYRLILRLVDTPNTAKALAFLYRPEQGHIQAADLERLAMIQEHLRLAAAMTEGLALSRVPARGLLDALELAGSAALLIEPDLSILFANALARAILRRADGLGAFAGALRIDHGPSRDAFARLAAEAHRALVSPLPTREGGTTAARRRSLLPPYLLTVAPLARDPRFLAPDRNLLLVLIRDPMTDVAPADSVLIESFGLSAGEAAACRAFARAPDAAAVGAALGLSPEAARALLAGAMARIGLPNEAELMRFLKNLPAG